LEKFFLNQGKIFAPPKMTLPPEVIPGREYIGKEGISSLQSREGEVVGEFRLSTSECWPGIRCSSDSRPGAVPDTPILILGGK